MTRNKVFSLVLAVAMVVALTVAPILTVQTTQIGSLTHLVPSGSMILSIGGVNHPAILACEGCSAGGSGPG